MSEELKWIPIKNIDLISEQYTVMSCDTRDFCMICHKENIGSCRTDMEDYLMSLDEDQIADSIIDSHEIIPLLESLQSVLRRHNKIKLVFNVPKDMAHYAGWFKYIRFYRDKDKYVMYTNSCDDIYLLSRKIVRPDNIKLDRF